MIYELTRVCVGVLEAVGCTLCERGWSGTLEKLDGTKLVEAASNEATDPVRERPPFLSKSEMNNNQELVF